MEAKRRPLAMSSVWRCLFIDAVALGCLLGLAEVCWTYLLPTTFPGRRYPLPVSEVGQFILTAVVTDVLLVVVGGAILGVLVYALRRAWKRAEAFHHWPDLIRTILMVATGSYFFLGCVLVYHAWGVAANSAQRLGVLVGTLAIVLLSVVLSWLIGYGRRRIGKVLPAAAWLVAVIAVTTTTAVRYLNYRAGHTIDIRLPALNLEDPPNVLLVTLDTTRADYLGPYGHDVVQTPALDALAADAIVFDDAIAQASSTTPSHCSLMTSTYASRHEATNGTAMRSDLPTLAQSLAASRYQTAAFVSCHMTRSANSGLHRGFDYYEDSISRWSSYLRHDTLQFVIACYLFTRVTERGQIPGDIVSNRALQWLENRRPGPFFLWLHYFDPHTPYDAPEPYKHMYRGKLGPNLPQLEDSIRYAGEITYVDAQLGRVLDALKRKGLYENMLIIVTADHGEALGEMHDGRPARWHSGNLYETTVRVPLIVKLPGGQKAKSRVPDVVQLVDVAPTVLDWLGVPNPATYQGRSFGELLTGYQRTEPRAAFSEAVNLAKLGQITSLAAKRSLMCMRTADIKYICDDLREREELYELRTDPAETTNVSARKTDVATACYQKLLERLGDSAVTQGVAAEIDPRVIKHLKALGYLDDDSGD